MMLKSFYFTFVGYLRSYFIFKTSRHAAPTKCIATKSQPKGLLFSTRRGTWLAIPCCKIIICSLASETRLLFAASLLTREPCQAKNWLGKQIQREYPIIETMSKKWFTRMYQIVPITDHFLRIFRELSFKKDKIKKQPSEFIKIMNRLFFHASFLSTRS